jgi:hypothetical protein
MSATFDVVFSIAVCGTCVMAVIAPWLLMRAAEPLPSRCNCDSFMRSIAFRLSDVDHRSDNELASGISLISFVAPRPHAHRHGAANSPLSRQGGPSW